MSLTTRSLRLHLLSVLNAPLAGAEVTLQLSAYQADGPDIVPLMWTLPEDGAVPGDYVGPIWPNNRGSGGTHYDMLVQANGQALLTQAVTVLEGTGGAEIRAKINAAPYPAVYAAEKAVSSANTFADASGESASRARAAEITAVALADSLGDIDGARAEVLQARDASIAAADTAVPASEVAVIARIAAEAARDSLNTTGKVFTDAEGTAAGIAATTNLQQFAVLSADLQSWGIFRNNAGVPLPLSGTYTQAYFDGLIKRQGAWGGGFAILDGAKYKLIEIGKVRINHPDTNNMRAQLATLPGFSRVASWSNGLAQTDAAGYRLFDISQLRINHPDTNSMRLSIAAQGVQRLAHAFFLLGDSRNAQEASTRGVSGVVKNRLNFFHKANYELGQAMLLVGTRAVSGQRSDQYLTASNINAAAQSVAKNVLIYGIVNDLDAGYTAAQIWTGYNGSPGMRSAVLQLVAAGMRVILGLEAGAIGFSSAKIGEIAKYRQLCYELQETTPNVELLDLAAPIWGGSTGSAAISFLPGTMQIESTIVHPGTLGGAYAARSMVDLAKRLGIAPLQRKIIAPWEVYANGGVQLLNNPYFSPATGGVSGTGVTGNTPYGWSTGVSGGGLITGITPVAVPNGVGNDLVLNISGAASGDGGYLRQDIAVVPAAGDIFQGGVEISVGAGSTNFCGAWVQAGPNFSDATFLQFNDGYVTPAHGAGPTTAYTDTLETDKFVWPAGKTIAYWTFYAARWVFSGPGSAQITVRAPQQRKRFS